jgi:predicted nucleotide-binding protein
LASAFVSYAHEDQEFVLVLVGSLQGQGLAIHYDQVALRVGDSLIERIAREIADGDFLIAMVSPDSVGSGWCQRELSLDDPRRQSSLPRPA